MVAQFQQEVVMGENILPVIIDKKAGMLSLKPRTKANWGAF